MNASEMLRALGYDGTREELSRFQRDYNKLFPAGLLVSGKLDRATQDAVGVAHSSRVIFRAVRDGEGW